jgi:hypothetical protein
MIAALRFLAAVVAARCLVPSSTPGTGATAALTNASRPDGSAVDAQLQSIDQSYLTLETGQHVDLTFAVPPVTPGLTRSFIAQTTGWYRVHGAETADPDTTLLAELRQPRGAARTVIRYSNRALEALR